MTEPTPPTPESAPPGSPLDPATPSPAQVTPTPEPVVRGGTEMGGPGTEPEPDLAEATGYHDVPTNRREIGVDKSTDTSRSTTIHYTDGSTLTVDKAGREPSAMLLVGDANYRYWHVASGFRDAQTRTVRTEIDGKVCHVCVWTENGWTFVGSFTAAEPRHEYDVTLALCPDPARLSREAVALAR